MTKLSDDLMEALGVIHDRITALTTKPGIPRAVWAELCCIDSDLTAIGIGRTPGKADRTLSGVQFKATVSGVIHSTKYTIPVPEGVDPEEFKRAYEEVVAQCERERVAQAEAAERAANVCAPADDGLRYDAEQRDINVRHIAITRNGLELGGFTPITREEVARAGVARPPTPEEQARAAEFVAKHAAELEEIGITEMRILGREVPKSPFDYTKIPPVEFEQLEPQPGPTVIKLNLRDCTCTGTCKGAAGLGPGWRCVLGGAK